MTRAKSLCALALALGWHSTPAQGQHAPPNASAATASPMQSTPAAAVGLRFESALRGYRSFTDEPVAPWRDSNDTVRRIGGWKAYARESYEVLRAVPAARPAGPDAAAPAASAASAPPGSPEPPAAPGRHLHHGTRQPQGEQK